MFCILSYHIIYVKFGLLFGACEENGVHSNVWRDSNGDRDGWWGIKWLLWIPEGGPQVLAQKQKQIDIIII